MFWSRKLIISVFWRDGDLREHNPRHCLNCDNFVNLFWSSCHAVEVMFSLSAIIEEPKLNWKSNGLRKNDQFNCFETLKIEVVSLPGVKPWGVYSNLLESRFSKTIERIEEEKISLKSSFKALATVCYRCKVVGNSFQLFLAVRWIAAIRPNKGFIKTPNHWRTSCGPIRLLPIVLALFLALFGFASIFFFFTFCPKKHC